MVWVVVEEDIVVELGIVVPEASAEGDIVVPEALAEEDIEAPEALAEEDIGVVEEDIGVVEEDTTVEGGIEVHVTEKDTETEDTASLEA